MTPHAPPRAPLRLVIASTVLVGAAYASAFGGAAGAHIGAWLMAAGASGLVSSTIALGALRHRNDRRLAPLLWGTFIVLFGSFATALLLPASEHPGAPMVLGFPIRAAIVLYGVGVIPLLVLPLAYAWTFDESRLDPDRVRRRAAELTGVDE